MEMKKMKMKSAALLTVTVLAKLFMVASPVSGFVTIQRPTVIAPTCSGLFMANSPDTTFPTDQDVKVIESASVAEARMKPEALSLKRELIEIADRTKRGFQASASDRKRARELIFDLARYNPTPEPASPYYTDDIENDDITDATTTTLAGKWTLVFTDAPDITGLDTSRNPFSTAKLGRIGQECSPPFIKNVIEWKRPDWAKNLPLAGSEESRILQKVVTSASSTRKKPLLVNLKVAGLELGAGVPSFDSKMGDSNETNFSSRIQSQGILAGLLSMNPIDLKGPLNPPFGQFEILYLDDDLRIIITGQNYVAVNRRIKEGEEWF